MSASTRAAACIDWAGGRVLGFALPADEGVLHERVTLCLDGVPVTSAVASQSVFALEEAWGGMPLPPREQSCFAMRIPQGRLLASHLAAAQTTLQVLDSQGAVLLDTVLAGPPGVLSLTEGAPVDLLYEARFRAVVRGEVQGEVLDRHGLGRRPPLRFSFNDGPAQAVPWLDEAAEDGLHRFAIPLPVAQLEQGANRLSLTGLEGQPLACYPIQLGGAGEGDTSHRLQVLEAEVQFLKQWLLTRPDETAPARLDLLKTEVVGLCSEMLSLQRVQLEREFRAQLGALSAGRQA